MTVTRKEKETNQQVLRRFNRSIQQSDLLTEARERKNFVKPLNRFALKRDAVRKTRIRDEKQWY
jgi:ribosomal protein S21